MVMSSSSYCARALVMVDDDETSKNRIDDRQPIGHAHPSLTVPPCDAQRHAQACAECPGSRSAKKTTSNTHQTADHLRMLRRIASRNEWQISPVSVRLRHGFLVNCRCHFVRETGLSAQQQFGGENPANAGDDCR